MGRSRSFLEVVTSLQDRDCSDSDDSEDFLSGTFGFLLPLVGESGPGKKVDGKEDVGVSD